MGRTVGHLFTVVLTAAIANLIAFPSCGTKGAPVALVGQVDCATWNLGLAYVPRHERSLPQTMALPAGLVLFLCLSGGQSFRTVARLAFFTDKLCIAILIVALIRAHDGWEAFRRVSSWPTGSRPRLSTSGQLIGARAVCSTIAE